jgi:hypothetical protein
MVAGQRAPMHQPRRDSSLFLPEDPVEPKSPLQGMRNKFAALKQVGDCVPVLFHGGDVIVQRAANYAVKMATLVVISQGQVSNPDRLPKLHLVAPFGLSAGTSRDRVSMPIIAGSRPASAA